MIAFAVAGAATLIALTSASALGQSTDSSRAVPPIDTVVRRIDDALPTGRTIRQLISRADTSQRYALYLPRGYAPGRQWPVLFLMDPRGRALVPMSWLQQSAERYGYIAISSYNTLSDGPAEPNLAAMTAMLEDVQQALSVDSRRFYLVGFSGTARFAWEMTQRLTGSVAGIVSAGAGAPGGRTWVRAHVGSSSPVVFGAVGELDPNYEEVRALDADLDSTRTVHHVERFAGRHEWPPAELADRAIAFFELQAMRRGLEPRDQPWIDSIYTDWAAAAERLATAGDATGAVRQLRLVRSDFDGLADTKRVIARISALEQLPDVRRAAQVEVAAAQRDRTLGSSLMAYITELRQADSPPPLDQARRRLDLDGLRRAASRTDDRIAATTAERALERVFAHMTFYVPREFFNARRYAHAGLALAIARLIKPNDAGACFWHARALAQLGDKPNALAALECAAASGQLPAAAVESDPLLEPIRSELRYQEAVRRLR